LASTFPQASKLTVDEEYLPASFYLHDIGGIVRSYHHGKKLVNATNPEEFGLTVDLTFEVVQQGSTRQIFHKIEEIPIISKKAEPLESITHCQQKLHG